MTGRLAVDGGTPVRERFLPFGVPVIGEEEIQEVVDTLRSGWIGQGERVARFEQDFAAYVGAPVAIAVSSCTAALHISLVAAGIAPGDEVLVPAMTFAASATAVEHAHGTPVFCDVDPETWCMRATDAAAVLTGKTRAIVAVHNFGNVCEMGGLLELGRQKGIPILEDAAESFGSTKGAAVAALPPPRLRSSDFA